MDDEPNELRPPKREQLSKTPSWIMLGIVLGAAFVLAWPRKPTLPAPPPEIVTPSAPKPSGPPTIERATFFEGVFAELSHNAVWQDETTEVAFWNAELKAFSECYEVLRYGDKFYFRSIPHLTRPVLTEGVSTDSPLQFTAPSSAIPETVIYPSYRKTDQGAYRPHIEPERLPPIATPDVVTPLKKPAVEVLKPDGK
jgi:hypothetical protein